MGSLLQRAVFRASHRLLPWLSQPLGHFYSPIGDPAELIRRSAQLWPSQPPETPGLEFDEPGQRRLLREVFPRMLEGFDYPAGAGEDPHRFFLDNSQYSHADARAVFGDMAGHPYAGGSFWIQVA